MEVFNVVRMNSGNDPLDVQFLEGNIPSDSSIIIHDDDYSVHIDIQLLDATIRTLCAIRNAQHYGLGIRPLHIITKGEYAGVLCMEVPGGEVRPYAHHVHLIEFDKGWLSPPIAEVVCLCRDYYTLYNPSVIGAEKDADSINI